MGLDMEDKELERLMRKRMLELQRRLEERKRREEVKEKREDPKAVLDRIFYGRAWEVMETAWAQYPGVARLVQDALIRMARAGRVKRVSGEELYTLFLRLGYRVRLKTSIRIHRHGEVKTLEEKLREDLEG